MPNFFLTNHINESYTKHKKLFFLEYFVICSTVHSIKHWSESIIFYCVVTYVIRKLDRKRLGTILFVCWLMSSTAKTFCVFIV